MFFAKKIFSIKATVISAGLIAMCASAQAQELNGDQITQLLSGKCTAYWGPSEGTECFRANGQISYNDKSDGKGVGGWVINGNRLCTKYDTTPDTSCSVIRKTGDNQYTDGTYNWRVTN